MPKNVQIMASRMKRIQETWGWKWSPFHLFTLNVVSLVEALFKEGIISLLICIFSGLVTTSQFLYVRGRVEGPHDTKPDLNKNLLLTFLLEASLGADRIKISVLWVRPRLPRPLGFPCCVSVWITETSFLFHCFLYCSLVLSSLT